MVYGGEGGGGVTAETAGVKKATNTMFQTSNKKISLFFFLHYIEHQILIPTSPPLHPFFSSPCG